ncbi:MAG: DUF1552 domain-containing protein [Myxococcales bacterium]|nr:DUF1552 domain-containing protein [Myxococcales bacterium]
MTTKITRRGLLSGSAAALGSAGLWSMFTQRALAGPASPPTRVIFWYVPEGCAQQAFWPASGPGALNIDMTTTIGGGLTPLSRGDSINQYRSSQMGTYCLQPLKDHESDLTLVSGFEIYGHSDHGSTTAALTGGTPDAGSLDQWLGQHLQGSAPFPAILSTLYGEHVHYNFSNSIACPFRTLSGGLAAPTWNPVTTFNQVFPDGIGEGVPQGPNHRLLSRLRVMGAVRARLDDAHCRGGVAARERLESYLESIERIESETDSLIDLADSEVEIDVNVDMPPDWATPTQDDKYWRVPENFPALARIQIDTTVAALALDRTRVSLMQFSGTSTNNGLPGDHYKHLGLTDLEPGDVNDHYLGHEPDETRRRNQARIFRWYYGQLAYLIERLKSIPDSSGGTLFDSTLIVACSEFGSYNHRHNDVPYLLVGNPGGVFRKGVYLDALADGRQRSHADLLLTIARAVGMDLDGFGTSTTTYDELLA